MANSGNDLEFELASGNTVECANCPADIRQGDAYVMRGGLMYCSDECADDDVARRALNAWRGLWGHWR